jgi:hypothetical protein
MKTTALMIVVLSLLAQQVVKAQETDVAQQLIERLSEMTPEQAVAMRHGWYIPGLYVQCAGSLPGSPEEVPVLACQWGPAANVPTARALFWQEGGLWRSQPYPSEGIRGTAGLVRLYQSGHDLVVIMNVARYHTRYAEQPQLLRRGEGAWRLVWVPPSDQWSGYSATVEFAGDSLRRFTVWTDRCVLPKEQLWPFVGEFGLYVERWQRRNDQYVRLTRTEAPQPDMAVMHFVQAVARGNAAEAASWATDQRLVREAAAQEIRKASAIGFVPPTIAKQQNGDVIVTLEANNSERKPSWLITVSWGHGRWLVADIQPKS